MSKNLPIEMYPTLLLKKVSGTIQLTTYIVAGGGSPSNRLFKIVVTGVNEVDARNELKEVIYKLMESPNNPNRIINCFFVRYVDEPNTNLYSVDLVVKHEETEVPNRLADFIPRDNRISGYFDKIKEGIQSTIPESLLPDPNKKDMSEKKKDLSECKKNHGLVCRFQGLLEEARSKLGNISYREFLDQIELELVAAQNE